MKTRNNSCIENMSMASKFQVYVERMKEFGGRIHWQITSENRFVIA